MACKLSIKNHFQGHAKCVQFIKIFATFLDSRFNLLILKKSLAKLSGKKINYWEKERGERWSDTFDFWVVKFNFPQIFMNNDWSDLIQDLDQW